MRACTPQIDAERTQRGDRSTTAECAQNGEGKGLSVNQHRSGTPSRIGLNSLIHWRRFCFGWGPDRRRSGPHFPAKVPSPFDMRIFGLDSSKARRHSSQRTLPWRKPDSNLRSPPRRGAFGPPSSAQRQDRVEILTRPEEDRWFESHFRPQRVTFTSYFCDCGDGSGTAPAVGTSCCTRASRSRHRRPHSRDYRRILFRWQVRRRGTAAFS